MKKLFFAIILIAAIPCMNCTSSPKVPAVTFSDVIEKEWKLIEVHIDGKNINFDRSALADDGFGELFTLTFDAQNLSGVGAPNRYSVPYTQEKDMQRVYRKLLFKNPEESGLPESFLATGAAVFAPP